MIGKWALSAPTKMPCLIFETGHKPGLLVTKKPILKFLE
jgi:hypothetical protein